MRDMRVLRNACLRWLALAASVLQPQNSNAQTLPTISVTVTEPYELVEDVGTTRRLTRADIEMRNARTLDEALRLLPGVYVRTGGDGTPRIDVRGFRSRHVLLLINGVLVNSSADGQFDPARISTQAITEIKVSYGSSSVLYGDNALAAVIEITTVDDQPAASVELSGGTPGRKGIGLRYARTVGNWSLTGAISGADSNGFSLPDSFTPTPLEDGGRRLNSDRNRADARGAVGYRRSPSLAIASEWFVGTGSYGVPPGTINDPNNAFAQTPRFERVNDYRAASGQVSIVLVPRERFNLRAWAFRNTQREDRSRYDDATYSTMDDPLVPGTFHSRERTTVTGSSALGRIELQRFGRLRLAINQRRESFDSSGVIRDVRIGGSGGGGGGGGGGASQTASFAVRSFAIDSHVDVYSTGAEWQIQAVQRLGFVFGAAMNVQRRPGGKSDTAPAWLAGASYEATPRIRVHASLTRKVRVPSIDQLFNASSGNPALRSEHAYGLDIGAGYRLDTTSMIALSAFAAAARDFIERTSGSPFENQDEYRFRGAEVTFNTTRIPRLDLRVAYSFLGSDEVTPAGTRPLQTRPRHRGSLEWIWTPIDGSRVRGAAYQVGTQFYDSRGAVPILGRAEGFTVVDIGFTQTLSQRYDLAFDISNFFDDVYEQAYALPREGRAAVLTLRARW
jgi:outer membrane cobalamin receptor